MYTLRFDYMYLKLRINDAARQNTGGINRTIIVLGRHAHTTALTTGRAGQGMRHPPDFAVATRALTGHTCALACPHTRLRVKPAPKP